MACDAICQYLILCGQKSAARANALSMLAVNGAAYNEGPDFPRRALKLLMKFNADADEIMLAMRGGKSDKDMGLPEYPES